MKAGDLADLLAMVPRDTEIEIMCTDGPGFSWIDVDGGHWGPTRKGSVIDEDGFWTSSTHLPRAPR